ncbi:MAG: hypothetical protein AAGJ35_01520, partial [Myxococcota bacterium]
MLQFGNQIEVQLDKRHFVFVMLGAVVWTLLFFFLGMWSATPQGKQPILDNLQRLGWLDQQQPFPVPSRRCAPST